MSPKEMYSKEAFPNEDNTENKKDISIDSNETKEDKEDKEDKEILEKIKAEQQEAKERFKSLINFVSERYGNLQETEKKNYIIHNEEILDRAIELGIRNGFSKEELERLELGAILHDMTKADSVPEEYKDISNYTLAMHAKTASEEVPKILTDEYLKEQNIQGDPEEIRQEIAKAILEHMGPRPGFMTDMLEKFNKAMKEKGKEGVEYPYADGKISEVLLAADMSSLAGEKGRNKILSTRANVPGFIKDDKELSEEYKKYRIDLSQGEAALLSGFDSAEQALNMQKDERNHAWINQIIEESKKVEYNFPGSEKPMLWKDVSAKRIKYEEQKRIKEIEELLKAA